MYYYNQNKYDKTAYNKPDGTKKTIATSGCGVCCACMVINSLADKVLYTVPQMAKFSIKNKARNNYGTDEAVLLNALCKAHTDFIYKATNDIDDVIKCLKQGGMVICNQDDSHNVFSTAGHFVVADKLVNGNIDILDPQMYDGKYDSYGRPTRIVSKTKNGCIVTPDMLSWATQDSSPAFFCVSKKSVEYKAPNIKTGHAYTLTANKGIYNGCGSDTQRKKIRNVTLNAKQHAVYKNATADAILKAGTVVTAKAVKKSASGNLWVQIPSGWLCVWHKKTNEIFIKER